MAEILYHFPLRIGIVYTIFNVAEVVSSAEILHVPVLPTGSVTFTHVVSAPTKGQTLLSC